MVALAPANPALLWDTADSSTADGVVTQVIVHPLVLLHVLDHHTRRQEASGRVIGTLLGRREEEQHGVTKITVTNCFAVPHAERGDEVAIGKDFNKQMLALHTRTNRKEVVVGWYATAFGGSSSSDEGEQQQPSALIADTSSLIHDFYAGETDDGDPVHLVFDTTLGQDQLPVTAYKSTAVTVQGEPMGNLFHQVQLSLQGNSVEKIALQEMIRSNDEPQSVVEATEPKESGKDDGKASEEAGLQQAMEQLHDLLGQTLQYVNDVVEGKVPLDEDAQDKGRRIADCILATIPRIRPELWDTKLFHQALQDLLMVTALSNMTRTQVTVAEKLNASLGKV